MFIACLKGFIGTYVPSRMIVRRRDNGHFPQFLDDFLDYLPIFHEIFDLFLLFANRKTILDENFSLARLVWLLTSEKR